MAHYDASMYGQSPVRWLLDCAGCRKWATGAGNRSPERAGHTEPTIGKCALHWFAVLLLYHCASLSNLLAEHSLSATPTTFPEGDGPGFKYCDVSKRQRKHLGCFRALHDSLSKESVSLELVRVLHRVWCVCVCVLSFRVFTRLSPRAARLPSRVSGRLRRTCSSS